MRKYTATELAEQHPNTTIVIVRGGVVQDVLNGGDYVVIDYDNLENGVCPYCFYELENEEHSCPLCHFTWE